MRFVMYVVEEKDREPYKLHYILRSTKQFHLNIPPTNNDIQSLAESPVCHFQFVVGKTLLCKIYYEEQELLFQFLGCLFRSLNLNQLFNHSKIHYFCIIKLNL